MELYLWYFSRKVFTSIVCLIFVPCASVHVSQKIIFYTWILCRTEIFKNFLPVMFIHAKLPSEHGLLLEATIRKLAPDNPLFWICRLLIAKLKRRITAITARIDNGNGRRSERAILIASDIPIQITWTFAGISTDLIYCRRIEYAFQDG